MCGWFCVAVRAATFCIAASLPFSVIFTSTDDENEQGRSRVNLNELQVITICSIRDYSCLEGNSLSAACLKYWLKTILALKSQTALAIRNAIRSEILLRNCIRVVNMDKHYLIHLCLKWPQILVVCPFVSDLTQALQCVPVTMCVELIWVHLCQYWCEFLQYIQAKEHGLLQAFSLQILDCFVLRFGFTFFSLMGHHEDVTTDDLYLGLCMITDPHISTFS